MRKLRLFGLVMAGLVTAAVASSDAAYPADWKTYKSVETPLIKGGAVLPGCKDKDAIKALPKEYNKFVKQYCKVTKDGLGEVEVLVKPSALETYKTASQQYEKDDFLILHIKEHKLLFVTGFETKPKPIFGEHEIKQQPVYGVYDEEGVDKSGAPGSGIHPTDCKKCHDSYGELNANGQIGRIQ